MINQIAIQIHLFQETAAKPFVVKLKDNIPSRFASSHYVESALSIFDSRKVPSVDSTLLIYLWGCKSIDVDLAHYGKDAPAQQ